MPIYAYKCESCGYAKDALQKMSDAPLTDCPHCGAATFKKQLTAAGFQLKGSGWYVTDFRGGNGPAPATSKTVESGGLAEASPNNSDNNANSNSSGAESSTKVSTPAVAASTASPSNTSTGGDASSQFS